MFNFASFVSWWQSGILFGTLIMLGALGEILTQKAGHLNLGVPGIMAIGGLAGFAGAYVMESHTQNAFLLIVVPIIIAMIASGAAGLLYSFFTVTLKANQNVTGLSLTYVGVGLGAFGSEYLIHASNADYSVSVLKTAEVFNKNIAVSANLKDGFSQMFLSYGFMIYLTIVLAIVLHIVLQKTRVGLNLRSIGESPATADAAGVNVTKYKYLATIIGGAISGLGGLCYFLGYGGGTMTTANPIEAIGWLAVALVIFATWKPANTIWGSYLFALLYWFWSYANVFGIKLNTVQQDLTQMLPYVVTILVLIFIAFRKKKENQPPASLGLNYFREDR